MRELPSVTCRGRSIFGPPTDFTFSGPGPQPEPKVLAWICGLIAGAMALVAWAGLS